MKSIPFMMVAPRSQGMLKLLPSNVLRATAEIPAAM